MSPNKGSSFCAISTFYIMKTKKGGTNYGMEF